ncbi:hypothetical protein D4764_03G0001510 [Takifugu flavidus]|uniref:Uncharacterized protein n=1 Tax=Takifugu flavidus TaxID=433684 RepID=A0A5C6N7M3_9TELE|nr:hypothetical protein D4764_03G0001510 [Takifugu flavidus]
MKGVEGNINFSFTCSPAVSGPPGISPLIQHGSQFNSNQSPPQWIKVSVTLSIN